MDLDNTNTADLDFMRNELDALSGASRAFFDCISGKIYNIYTRYWERDKILYVQEQHSIPWEKLSNLTVDDQIRVLKDIYQESLSVYQTAFHPEVVRIYPELFL
jgi:hypothetical protein